MVPVGSRYYERNCYRFCRFLRELHRNDRKHISYCPPDSAFDKSSAPIELERWSIVFEDDCFTIRNFHYFFGCDSCSFRSVFNAFARSIEASIELLSRHSNLRACSLKFPSSEFSVIKSDLVKPAADKTVRIAIDWICSKSDSPEQYASSCTSN